MSPWKQDLQAFFDFRAADLRGGVVTLAGLCYVSGRDPRLWSDQALYDDMMGSIRDQLGLSTSHSLLEVGCASGFLARGLAPLCREYVGVDIAPHAVEVASSLGLENCRFQVADATALPFEDGSFDRVISYDVFTNFAEFDFARKVMSEMLRVAAGGGKVMIGSLADDDRKAEYATVAGEFARKLEAEHGPAPTPPSEPALASRVRKWWLRKLKRVEPGISCYYFRKGDFEGFGAQRGLATEVLDIHAKNPYRGYRFNVVYTKPEPS